MKIVTLLVTRSKSCHVKTLHSVLRINITCLQKGFDNEIAYVDDDPFMKAETIQRYMKSHDRIIFVDFGVGLDDNSIAQCFEKHTNVGCLVFPGVKEGVDWELFKSKVKDGSSEPVGQMGLHFDTEVGMKISDNIYRVDSTNAKAWFMNTKNVIKSIKDKKSSKWTVNPKMFEKFIEQSVRIYAFTAAKLTMTYTHECVSNILNAAGVKVN
jgi:hypothetical protein